MLQAGAAAARARGLQVKGWQPDKASSSAAKNVPDILLFCRLPDEPYVGCGRLALRAVDLGVRPLRFLWQLCHIDELRRAPTFLRLVPDAAAAGN